MNNEILSSQHIEYLLLEPTTLDPSLESQSILESGLYEALFPKLTSMPYCDSKSSIVKNISSFVMAEYSDEELVRLLENCDHVLIESIAVCNPIIDKSICMNYLSTPVGISLLKSLSKLIQREVNKITYDQLLAWNGYSENDDFKEEKRNWLRLLMAVKKGNRQALNNYLCIFGYGQLNRMSNELIADVCSHVEHEKLINYLSGLPSKIDQSERLNQNQLLQIEIDLKKNNISDAGSRCRWLEKVNNGILTYHERILLAAKDYYRNEQQTRLIRYLVEQNYTYNDLINIVDLATPEVKEFIVSNHDNLSRNVGLVPAEIKKLAFDTKPFPKLDVIKNDFPRLKNYLPVAVLFDVLMRPKGYALIAEIDKYYSKLKNNHVSAENNSSLLLLLLLQEKSLGRLQYVNSLLDHIYAIDQLSRLHGSASNLSTHAVVEYVPPEPSSRLGFYYRFVGYEPKRKNTASSCSAAFTRK